MRRFIAALFFFTLVPLAAHAQYALPGFSGAVRIGMDPSYPQPGDTVKLSLDSSFTDLDTSSISWQVDGKAVPGSTKTITVTAGPLGSQTEIDAEVTTQEGSVIAASTTITPTRIDILYDGDSYVPPFYEGRALPAAGGTLRLQAFASFKKPDGSLIAPGDIIFTWKRNGEVLGSVSGRGSAAVSIPSPYLFGRDTITVEARSVDQSLAGESSVVVSAADPVLRLYQDHPLFGLRLDQAIGTTTTIADREMTFTAIPFFATVRTPADDALSYDWAVNGKPVSSAGDTKNSLTLGAPAGGSADVSVSLSHATNIFFSADAHWTILFTNDAQRQNPFASPH